MRLLSGRATKNLVGVAAVAALVGWGAGACSGEDSNALTASTGTNSGSSSLNGNGGGLATVGSATANGGSSASGLGGGCAAETQEADVVPLDLVIIQDQSGSMDFDGNGQLPGTLWELVTDALKEFVQSPDSEGLGIGLNYFPLPGAPCQACTTTNNTCGSGNLCVTPQGQNDGCCHTPTGETCSVNDGQACPTAMGGLCFQGNCYQGGLSATCSSADYAALDVPIGLLPGNGAAISSSLDAHSPLGLTPTAPALQGGIEAAVAYAQQNPDHQVVVVLATDGVPTECTPQDINQIAAIAADALAATPSVLTFVIGIGDLGNLNTIAQAGGTDQAFIIQPSGSTTQQFIDALNEIRGSLLSCEYEIPEPDEGTIDYGQVNVQVTPSGGEPIVLAQVPGAADCDSSGGWYYDNPGMPENIFICPASCDQLKGFEQAKLEIVFGCATILK